MYAIFESGGKQHKVVEGETLRLEKLDAAAGDKVDFDKVMLVNDGKSLNVGAPYVVGGKITAEVVEQGRGDKVKIIKFRRRKHHEKQMGHRQSFTEVKITKIAIGKKAAAKKAEPNNDEADVETKAKAESKVQAEPKAKATTKAKAEPKAKAETKKAEAPKAKKAPAKKATAKKAAAPKKDKE